MRVEERAKLILGKFGMTQEAYEAAVEGWAKRRGWLEPFGVDMTIQHDAPYTHCVLTRGGEVLGMGSARCSSEDMNVPHVGALISLWRALDNARRRSRLAGLDPAPAPGVQQAGIRDARAERRRSRSNIFGTVLAAGVPNLPKLEPADRTGSVVETFLVADEGPKAKAGWTPREKAGPTTHTALEALDGAFREWPLPGDVDLAPAGSEAGINFYDFVERGRLASARAAEMHLDMQRADAALYLESALDQADGFAEPAPALENQKTQLRDRKIPGAEAGSRAGAGRLRVEVDASAVSEALGAAHRAIDLERRKRFEQKREAGGLKKALESTQDELRGAIARLRAEERKTDAQCRRVSSLSLEISKLAAFIERELGGPHVEGSAVDNALAYLEGAQRYQLKLLALVGTGLKLASQSLNGDESVRWTGEAVRFCDEAGAEMLKYAAEKKLVVSVRGA